MAGTDTDSQQVDGQQAGRAATDADFEALLAYLSRSRSFDFLGYKRASLMRRVDKAMEATGVKHYSDYLDYLQVHPEEFERLFNTILINVTSFFRDASAWEYIGAEILPRIIATKKEGEPIRLWSAGCASGQEPYSLAIALAEKLGFAAFRERVKIYATDVDEEALAQARSAAYTPREVQGIPPLLLAKYFEFDAGRYVFHRDLRRALIFGRHDLLRDAPISRIDLLACRNTVMYFNAEVQEQIMARFHFAIGDGGYLFLGKAEMLFSHSDLFLPVDLKRRVFVKVGKPGLRERLLLMAQAGAEPLGTPPAYDGQLREAALAAGPVPQIAVDLNGVLVLANERARTLLRLTMNDMDRPLRDLEVSYRPIELRSCIEQALAERRTVSIPNIPYAPGGETLFLDVQVVPLQQGGTLLGVSISFTDVTLAHQLAEDLQKTSRELETAYEELQSTNEELETTNEELQSTIEELETTNEELQSTNEELETTNEELQSTNEELQTINDEARVRSEEMDQVNSFLESILASLRGGVIVLDRDLDVVAWNGRSQDLWGLRADEAQGRPFLTLDIGLPVDALAAAVRACLTGETDYKELVLEARNRRGRMITCRVTLTPMLGSGGIQGVIVLAEEPSPASNEND